MDGGMERTFDYSSDPTCREFTTASFNPTGDAVVLGNYDNFHVFSHNQRWDQTVFFRTCLLSPSLYFPRRKEGIKTAARRRKTGAADIMNSCFRELGPLELRPLCDC